MPDWVRQDLPEGGVRLAQGGRTIFVSKEGRYMETPRQDLSYVLYSVHGLAADDFVRYLAGDVPGSPFLRNGVAVDLVHEVDEEGHRYVAIGVSEAGERVSQLWVSAETGLPVSLVEQFPVMRSQNPHAPNQGFSGMSETRFHYEKIDEQYSVPVRMTRYLDGRELGHVELTNLAFDRKPAAERFDLARLGGAAKPPAVVPRKASASAGKKQGPGLYVPSLGNEHIESPFFDHAPYNSSPPTSGPHTPYLADWGIHKTPIPPEVQVHNLEDGGVLVQYRCDEPCPDLVANLEGLALLDDHVVVAPYPLMEHRIALTAWERLLVMDAFDQAQAVEFVEAFAGVDHHPSGAGR